MKYSTLTYICCILCSCACVILKRFGLVLRSCPSGGGRGCYSWEILVNGVLFGSKNHDPISHQKWVIFHTRFQTCGPFLKRPGNFSCPKANFKIKTCWKVAQFVAHKPVNFPSLTDSFIVLLSKSLKLWSWMQTQQTQNSFPGPKSYRDFRETCPGARFSNVPVTFRARNQIFKSKYIE